MWALSRGLLRDRTRPPVLAGRDGPATEEWSPSGQLRSEGGRFAANV